MAWATRSFILPVGLADSSFAMTRAEPDGTRRRSSTRGVLPIASRTCFGVCIVSGALFAQIRLFHLRIREDFGGGAFQRYRPGLQHVRAVRVLQRGHRV